MISYFEIGGDIVELKADYDYGSGKTSAKQHRASKSRAKPGRGIGRDLQAIKSQSLRTSGMNWEDVGHAAGAVATAAYAWATLPVVLVDGPLPFVDLAWAVSVHKFGRTSTRIGGRAGRILDQHEFMYE